MKRRDVEKRGDRDLTRVAKALREEYDLPAVRLVEVGFKAKAAASSWTASPRHRAIVSDRGDAPYAIVSDTYRLMPHEVGLARMLGELREHRETLGEGELTVDTSDRGRLMRARVRFPDVKVMIGRGDPVTPELTYVNSYDGRRSAVNRFKAEAHVWRTWNETPLTHAHVEEGLAPFGAKQRVEILAQVEKEGASTLWLFYNVLTWLVTHWVKSLQRRVVLDRALSRVAAGWRAGR